MSQGIAAFPCAQSRKCESDEIGAQRHVSLSAFVITLECCVASSAQWPVQQGYVTCNLTTMLNMRLSPSFLGGLKESSCLSSE